MNRMSRKVTKNDIVVTIITLSFILIPLFLIVVFPENYLISLFFSGWKIFIFWFFVSAFTFIYRHKIDNFFK